MSWPIHDKEKAAAAISSESPFVAIPDEEAIGGWAIEVRGEIVFRGMGSEEAAQKMAAEFEEWRQAVRDRKPKGFV